MSQQPVNHGTTPGDGQGESLFNAFAKVNDNDAELFGAKTEFVANYAALPAMGQVGKIYVTLDDDAMYRWTGTGYDDLGGIQFVANAAALPAVGEALKAYVALDTGIAWWWTGSAYRAVGWNAAGNRVIRPDGVECAALPLDSGGYPAGRGLRSSFSQRDLTSRTYRGSWGKKIASWNALQNSAGTASVVTTTDLPPFADNATKVLRLDQNATASFGQQNPIDGNQPYLPSGTSPGFSAGVWVKNPNARTLNFQFLIYNAAANHNISWNCAVEPGDWRFLTLSPSQQVAAGWVFGTDTIGYVRITQENAKSEGAWQAGEYLLFGNVYADVAGRPLFALTFDDGNDNQVNPSSTAIVSGTAYVSSSYSDVFATAAVHQLIIGMPIVFTDAAPTGLTVGTKYWVATVPDTTHFTLATDNTLATPVTSTGFAGTANYQYAGTQLRSGRDIVESYGFKGSLFIVPSWLGSNGQYGYTGGANKFMSASDVQAMYRSGWSVGSHTNTHPANADNAGLRLLGPYGYFLSNPYDNLPAAYLSTWSITASYRRRVTGGSQASPSVFAAENAHKFLLNQPIVFTDVAPTGCVLGVTYYVASIPSSTTFTLATDQGTLTSKVNNTTGAWAGTANYRWPGSSNDDTAIYQDIMDGINGVLALGIPTAAKFFALPQGGWDSYVRSACIRAGLQWVRGTSQTAHSIQVGVPSGGGGIITPGGWLAQPDSVQTDGGASPAITTIKAYVDACVTQGACGCNYHHSVSGSNISNLDSLCAHLRAKVDAKVLDVVTLDEMARIFGF